jgi:LPPG:FO 2-phospho-L-lactate transferase
VALKRIVALVGGVGGAKLAYGLAQLIPTQDLTVIVNVGDDFELYGLKICPDLDTILYTLSQRVDTTNGWGVAGDTTAMLETLRGYGEDIWFRLGDQDLATHLLRTHMLHNGHTLTQVVTHLAQRMGITARVLPVTDAAVPTMIDTIEHGELPFQTYFVRHRWQPQVRGVRFVGAAQAQVSAEVRAAVAAADAILIAPSNPWLSVAPMLAVGDLRAQLLAREVPRVAVTPIIGGRAVKGPAAKLMGELGFAPTAQTVLDYYGTLVNGFVYDAQDQVSADDVRLYRTNTLMQSGEDKVKLAQNILDWIGRW